MNFGRHALGVALLAAAAGLAAPDLAHACGGCFSPPMTVQTVTYHRMALSVSTTRTTLWDQFGYTGRPEEFSWILPIQGGPDVRVELADVRFLAALDDATSVQQVVPPSEPTRQCAQCYTPPPAVQYYCGRDSERAGAPSASDAGFYAAADAAAADAGGMVTVLREESVGPYQVATIRGTDATALRTWLTTNNYVVPAAMEPVLDHYIALHMDFVALRLRDGVGLGRMQPVRVSAPGYQPVLPLRMVAAGVADHVELVLMTLSDSRLAPTNFAPLEIRDEDMTWTFGRDTNPLEVFRRTEAQMRAAAGGRAWLTETATTTSASQLDAIALNAVRRYLAASDAGSPMEDMNVAEDGLGPSPVLTRLHTDLTVDALDRDLMLGASTGGERARTYQIARTDNTSTPAACPQLSCSTGLVIGGEGEIRDPFGRLLAPDTVLPALYTRGSIAEYTPRVSTWEPRYQDGRPYTPTPTRYVESCGPGGSIFGGFPGAGSGGSPGGRTGSGCAVGGPGSSGAGGALGLLALAAIARAAWRRGRRRD